MRHKTPAPLCTFMRKRATNPERQDKLRRAQWTERKSVATKVALGIAVVLAIGATAYGMSLLPEKPKNVHWHPTWEVYVNDENVRWSGRQFDMSMMGGGIHFHQPNDSTVHAETRSDRLTLGALLTRLRSEISDDQLRISEPALPAGEFDSSDAAPLRVFVKLNGEDWREVADDFASIVLADKARVLVTYAPSSDAAIEEQKASVEGPPDDPTAPMRNTSTTSAVNAQGSRAPGASSGR